MIAIIAFQLPEDQDRFNTATHADGLAFSLSDMDEYLRKRTKYEDLPDDVDDALYAARDKLREIMEGWDVSSVVG